MALTIGVNARRKSGKGTEYVRKDELLSPDGKVKPERLPEGAGGSAEGGSVDLQPLEKRVAALEAKPESEHVDLSPLTARVEALERKPNGGGAPNAFPRGNYDRSKYNRTVTEEEVEKMLRDGTAPKHNFYSEIAAENLKNLPNYMRAACCVDECPTAEKVILKEGVEFVRLSNEEPLQLFCNTTTLEVFVFVNSIGAEDDPITAYPYNILTKGRYFTDGSKYRFVYSVGNSKYDVISRGEGLPQDIVKALDKPDPWGSLTGDFLKEKRIVELDSSIGSAIFFDSFIFTTDAGYRYFRLNDKEKEALFKDEKCAVFKNIADGTLYKIEMNSRKYDDASEIGLPNPDAKYFKHCVLGQIPGIPGTYTIREDIYADLNGLTVRVLPTNPKPLEPVADQIKKLLGLS